MLALNIPPWPEYISSSYRYFEDDEKHVTRIVNFYVLLFIFERKLYFTEDGNEIELEPGEWYIQSPGLRQEGVKGSPAPIYYYIHFNASGRAIKYSENIFSQIINFPEETSRFFMPVRGTFDTMLFKSLFDRLNNLKSSQFSDALEKQAVFLEILRNLASTAVYHEDDSQKLVFRVMEYLDENYCNQITCKDLSHKFNFSVDYIARQMKNYTGVTPWQYIQRTRIEKAKELLLSTDYKLPVVAYTVGYNDPSVFFKSFKKQTGFAPGMWRMKNRGLNE